VQEQRSPEHVRLLLNGPHRWRLRCAARFNDDAGTWYADLITNGRGEPNEAEGIHRPDAASGTSYHCDLLHLIHSCLPLPTSFRFSFGAKPTNVVSVPVPFGANALRAAL
jgi:hypothetical protein